MKSLVFLGAFGLVAFGGLFFYLQQSPPTPKSDSIPLVTELPAQPTKAKKPVADDEEAPPPRPKSKATAKNDWKPPKGQERNAWSDAPKPGQKPKGLYYTIVSSGGPVPSRVIIHNTSLGVPLNILVIGASGADG